MEIIKNIYTEYTKSINNFFEDKSKEKIKEYSQYFTPISEANKLIEDLIIEPQESIRILDPAVGCGILSIKLIEKILKNYTPKIIILDIYDIDSEVLNISLNLLEKFSELVDIKINLHNKDFLYEKIEDKYDYIIQNPPYKKINQKDVSEELKIFINGQPNLYHLFIAKSLTLLNDSGSLAVISPKNYLSGLYTENLREYILKEFSITKIHTFDDRRTIFEKDVIQEICIVHISKKKSNEAILSHNGFFRKKIKIYDIVTPNHTKIIYTPSCQDDFVLLQKFKKFPFGTIGKEIFFKTGIVVQFRIDEKEKNLQEKPYNLIKNGVPLIVYRHINKDYFEYRELKDKSKNKAITLIKTEKTKSKMIQNGNYLLVRKSTDKKYSSLFQTVTYFKELSVDKIALDNSIAYFTNKNHDLSQFEVLGIKCILMSKQFDSYYRMINGSHTINVYELKNIHFPNLLMLKSIGKKFFDTDRTIESANEIMNKVFQL